MGALTFLIALLSALHPTAKYRRKIALTDNQLCLVSLKLLDALLVGKNNIPFERKFFFVFRSRETLKCPIELVKH